MPDSPRIRQAGGIVFRLDGDAPQVLLVKSRRDAAWIFPKGHIEPGEELAETILRETREETGAVGALVALLEPPLEFRSKKEDVRVRYGLVRWLHTEENHEPREQRWVSPPGALALLTHPDARQLLASALPLISQSADDESFRELLLADHAHLGDSLLRNEEDGERRANIFIAVVTGVGAALAFLMKGDYKPDEWQPLVIAALTVLALFGYLTLLRVINRNRVTDHYLEKLGAIRRHFVSGPDDPRTRALPFDPFEPPRTRAIPFTLGRGGWLQTVALMESLIAGGLVAALYPTPDWTHEAAAFGAGALVTWCVLIGVARAKSQLR